jgi:hypothetical protein
MSIVVVLLLHVDTNNATRGGGRNAHQQAVMPHQQVEFLQLVQRLAMHHALSIPIAYHTVFVGADHGAADRDFEAARANKPNELVGEGMRHLQTREPSRVAAFAFAVIVPPSSATAIAPRNAGPFQVLDHQLAKPVVPRDGIVHCHRDEQ